MNKIEHLGIAVKDLDASIDLYKRLLGTACYKTEFVESEQVQTAFFRAGCNKIELVSSMDDTSAIARFLERKGEGIHHVAFEVDDILTEMSRLKAAGFVLLNEEPKRGADNKLVCFVHPKSTKGVLIELCQEISQ